MIVEGRKYVYIFVVWGWAPHYDIKTREALA
jgi:hypothetical protein